MIMPSLSVFKELSLRGNLIPFYEEFPLESETPISAFLKIRDGSFSFLLESMEGVGKWGRYTFLGANPSILFRSKGSRFEVIKEGLTVLSGEERDPLVVLERILSRYKPVYDGNLPRFFGGAVGYVGYDYIRCLERIPDNHFSPPNLFDCYFMVIENLIVFDHLKNRHYRMSSSQAKLFASQVVMDVASRAQVLMGGRGYLRSELINQLSADARGMEYVEGTSNIQKMIIGRELLRMFHQEEKK